LSKFLWIVVILYALWILYTSSVALSELFTGLVVAIVLAVIVYRIVPFESFPNHFARRFFRFWVYLPVLLYRMLLANVDVAKRVLNPKLPLNPGFVKVRTALQGKVSRLVLSNSITLTPGTLTLDVDEKEGTLLVHAIDVEDGQREKLEKKIAGSFEPLVKEVFE